MTGRREALFGFEIVDLGLFWVRNFLVDLFWVERFWQEFFGLIKNDRTSSFSILCQTVAQVSFTTSIFFADKNEYF